MKKKIFLLLGMLISLYTYAHQGSIRGSVADEETRNPVEGALVMVENSKIQVFTDELGFYQINDLPAGQYSIIIRRLGFETFSQKVDVRDTETTSVMHLLKKASLELEAVEINAKPDAQSRVFSALDIRLRPANTSQDILRMVPGLFIAQHAGGGKAEQIFLRGFDIDHGTDISINVDGIPVNMVSHAHGQGYADLHFLIPETVERVQFNQGPYYAQHGNLATAGYVGFQTRNALDKNRVELQTGQFDTYRALGMFNLINPANTQNQHAYIATEYFYSNGYFDSPQAYNRFSAFGKYTGSLSPNTYLSASFSTFSSRWDASGQIPDRAVENGTIGFFGSIDDTEGGQTSRTNANLQLRTSLADGALLRNQFYFSRYEFELYSNFTFFLNDSLNGDQIRQRESRNLLGYQGAYLRSDKIGNVTFETEAGLQIRYDASRNNELSHTAGRQTIVERRAFGDIDEANIGAYISETAQIGSRLTLNAGLRFDQFNFLYIDKLQSQYDRKIETAQVVSPKFNAYFTINNRLQLFANTGYGFHSNDTRVVVQQKAEQILPQALGYEAGLVWKPFQRLVLRASAWHLNLEQEFVYVGDEAVVEPSGETNRQGLDLSARWQLFNGLFADLDLNYTHARAADAAESEDFIPLAPEWTSIGGLSFQTKGGLNGSLRYRYLGDRAANEDNSVVAKGYFLVDALLNYTKNGFEIGMSIENVLDNQWKEAQFDTESRLRNESLPVSEIHFTPGTPFNLKVHAALFF